MAVNSSVNSSFVHPRHLMANALLYYQEAAKPGVSADVALKLKAQGAQELQKTINNPAFMQFMEEVDRFDKQDQLAPTLTEASATPETCDVAHWDGTKMCLLRIAREHADPHEREVAFEMFKDEMIESCSILNTFSSAQLDKIMRFLCLLDPREHLKEILHHIWQDRKAELSGTQRDAIKFELEA